MSKIKVLAVTGIRSEYDILYPVIRTLKDNRKFDVKVAVCGTHLSGWHGFTAQAILKDGFKVADYIDYLMMSDRKVQRPKGIGLLINALSQTVEREKPDLLLVVGDREESIATAVVGNYTDTLVAHMGGGDPVYGNADDPIRFAVSKLAHIHFAFSGIYADNLKKIGEEKFRIFNVGDPALDNIRLTDRLNLKKINKFLGLNLKPNRFIVLIHHPLSSECEDSGMQMKTTLQGIEEFCKDTGFTAVGIYPNTDPGALDILEVIGKYKDKDFIRFYDTLPRDIFINMMRNAAALVGNSSMGLLEAPFYKLPVVNVGNRQKGRLNAGNVEFVGYDGTLINRALSKACLNSQYRKKIGCLKNPFGDGYTAGKVKNILLSLDLADKRWYIKHGVQ